MRIQSNGLKAAAAVLTAASVAAFAASAIAQKALSPAPSATAATFGDWVLNCERLRQGSKQARFCEVAQSIQVRGQQRPFARIAIGRAPSNRTLSITVLLPNDVSLPSVVRVGAKDKGLELHWTRCSAAGCFAVSPLTAKTLEKWRGTPQTSKISFENATGQEIGFPISFRGLSQALDALTKESERQDRAP